MEKAKKNTLNNRFAQLLLASGKRWEMFFVAILTVLIAISFLSFKSSNKISELVTVVKNGEAVLIVLVDPMILPIDKQDQVTSTTERNEERLDGNSEQRRAVRKLLEYIEQMSGAKLKVEAARKGATGLYVGLGSSFSWLNKDVSNLGQEGFLIQSDQKNLFLLANNPLGVRHAVNTFLTDQGCRWFFPGKVWEDIPQRSTIKVIYDTSQIPSFNSARTLWYGFGTYDQPSKDQHNWNYHNRMGSPAPVKIGHTEYGLDRNKDFAQHPDWFALVKGKRQPNKVCYSHPETIKKMTTYALNEAAGGANSISMSPSDGLGFCECNYCFGTAKGGLVKDTMGSFFSVRPDGVLICTVSETMFNAINLVAQEVRKKYPNVILGCYGYSAYSHPPTFKLEPNIFIQTTTHYRRTPLTLQEQMNLWGKRASQIGIRGYWSVYQWDWDNPTVGKFIPDSIQKDLQFYHKHNAVAFNTEASNNWAPRGLSYYIGSQLLWNVNANVKPLIRDFYEKAFGPAALAMERYYFRWYGPSVAVLNSSSGQEANGKELKIGLDEFADYNPQNSIASRAVLKAAVKDLDEAARIVSGQLKYQARIDLIRMYAYYLVLREKVREASGAKDTAAIILAIKNETEFGGRLAFTNMIHAKPLLNREFRRLFKDYEALLKDIPESQVFEDGWRKIGTVPTHDELEELWFQAKKYLRI